MSDLSPSKNERRLIGHVVEGDKKAKDFLSKPGYTEQFEEHLGYKPFPGTLNIQLDDQSQVRRSSLSELEQVEIEKWSDDDGNTFGAVYCYPCRINTSSASISTCHIVVPKRTEHGRDVLEIIAPERLRDVLNVSNGDAVTVTVC